MAFGKIDADFAQFLDSMVSLNALDRITKNLDDELKDSQVAMDDIKGMIDALPARAANMKPEPDSNGLRHEDISNFLSADTPKLLMSDMDEKTTADIDVDQVIATMKSYTEDLKKKFTQAGSQSSAEPSRKQLDSLDLEQYACSLDQLCKKLSNQKFNKRDIVDNRNAELEAKLSLLCDDVDMFTKMVEAKTSLSEANKKWCPTQQKTNALDYDALIDKLLSGINEVSYLLQHKN